MESSPLDKSRGIIPGSLSEKEREGRMFLSFCQLLVWKISSIGHPVSAATRQNKFLAKRREIIGITNLILRQNDKIVLFWKV